MDDMLEKYALFTVFRTLRETDTEESIRSLSRKANVGVATAKRCIDYLYEKNIVKRKIIGNLHQYSLDNESLLTRQLKIAMTSADIVESGLVEEIAKKYPEIHSIVWYGSTAIGTDSPQSDIDIAVIARAPLRLKPLSAETRLKREVSLSSFTLQEWRKKARTDKAYYDAVIIDGICIHGEMPVVV
ncbi:MAG: nucleotidyltransferase domain-containing protein [Nanoarchaeota archaeon]